MPPQISIIVTKDYNTIIYTYRFCRQNYNIVNISCYLYCIGKLKQCFYTTFISRMCLSTVRTGAQSPAINGAVLRGFGAGVKNGPKIHIYYPYNIYWFPPGHFNSVYPYAKDNLFLC